MCKSLRVLLVGSLFVLSTLLAGLIPALLPGVALGEQVRVRTNYAFKTPPGLEGRVEFWRLIFTKYGKNHRVFHHRQHPEIIYSVLDFSEFEQTLSGRKLQSAKERAANNETARIQGSLSRLASGDAPKDAFERRIEQMYRVVPGNKLANYREGALLESIRYQTGIKERFREAVVRSGRYLPSIEQTFIEEGLPPELGRIPYVESSFDYRAYSSVGAAGIWQFMRATGKRYMRVTAAIDERRDPILATRAAAKYLKNSYEDTESWPLAVTSYNHGLSGILRAARETGTKDLATIIRRYKGKSFGFASGNFYAEFLAALEVDQNASKYFPGVVRDPTVQYEEIYLGRPVLFRDLLAATKADSETLKELNKGLQEPITRNQTKIPNGYLLKVPLGTSRGVLALVPGSKVEHVFTGRQTRHIAGHQERVADDARVGGTRAEPAKSEVAGDAAEEEVTRSSYTTVPEIGPRKTGKEVQETGLDADAPPTAEEEELQETEQSYVVKKGDTVGAIAERFSVSTRALMQANALKSPQSLRIGKTLVIPAGKRVGSQAGVKPQAEASTRQYYTVKKGDTLGRISSSQGVSLKTLRSLNPSVRADRIKPGLKLRVR